MHFLITGGTGFLGRHLISALLARGDRVTLQARNFEKAKSLFGEAVNLVANVSPALSDIDVVINLAGEPIIDKRWTKKRKTQLIASRIDTTKALVEWMAALENKPKAFISGSAIGYYGNYSENMSLTEEDKPRYCFASELCKQWESEAKKAETLGVRVCTVRTGVVLDKYAGALQRMWLPFSLGLGGRVASGLQWLSWIHLKDMINCLLFISDNQSIQGAVNATAPEPVNYNTFTKAFARALKRPAFFPMPAFVLKLLLGEAAQLLIEGQKVVPKKLLDGGFEFEFKRVDLALEEIVSR